MKKLPLLHRDRILLEGFKELGLEEIDYNAGGGPGVMLAHLHFFM